MNYFKKDQPFKNIKMKIVHMCIMIFFLFFTTLSRSDVNQIKTLKKYMDYFIKTEGEGSWLLHPKTTPTNKDPIHWVQNYRWGPSKDSAWVENYAQFKDKRCELMWLTIYRWDSVSEKIIVEHLGAGQAYFVGTAELINKKLSASTLHGKLPNGKSISIHDKKDRSNMSIYTAKGHSWDEEAMTWKENLAPPLKWYYSEQAYCKQ